MMEAAAQDPARVIEIDLLGTLRRRWLQITFGVVTGVAAAAIYQVATVPLYESEFEILVGQRNSEVTQNGTAGGGDAGGESIHDDQLATHIRLLCSRKLIGQAVVDGRLLALPGFREVRESGGDPINWVLSNLDVSRGGDGSSRGAMVLRATYRDPDPGTASATLAAVYASYRAYVESQGQDSTAEAVELMLAARETHEAELTQAEADYRDFVAASPILLDGGDTKDVHRERLDRTEQEINRLKSSLAEARSRLEVIAAKAGELGEDTNAEVAASQLSLLSEKEVARLKLFLEMTGSETRTAEFQAEAPMRQEVARLQYSKLFEIMQRERQLVETFGSGHPLVEQTREELAMTRRFIETEAPQSTRPAEPRMDPQRMFTTYVAMLKNDIAERQKRLEVLQADARAEMQAAKRVESDMLAAAGLRSAIERARSRYEDVVARLQDLELSRSYAGFSTDLLAAPEAAGSPSWPQLPIVAAIGLVCGGFFGLILALLAEMLDSTFSGIADLEASVGAPALAHVPRFSARQLRRLRRSGEAMSEAIVCHHAPRSAESEMYRMARTALLLATGKGGGKTILITSPQPGDGKSTTIGNLAVVLAQTGRRVLLIDADLRRPVVAKNFGIEKTVGLADVLQGDATINEAVDPSGVENLTLMTAGSPTGSPAELLEGASLGATLRRLEQDYDVILVDAPPVLAVSDPIIVSSHADAVLLTVRVRKNGRRIVEQAVKVLRDNAVDLVGVVVNGVDGNAKTYRGGGGGDYAGGYVYRYHGKYAAADTSEAAPRRAARVASAATVPMRPSGNDRDTRPRKVTA